MLSVSNLSFAYQSGEAILSDFSMSAKPGEIIGLLGPSGCGKSTVLKMISGLLQPSSGSVSHGSDPSSSPQPNRRLGFVFQEPSLMPWLSVADNIELPAKLQHDRVSVARLENLLEMVGLSGMADRYPETLSGGQKMRVSIARALASEPDLLLLDEPFAALDEMLRFQMNELVLKLRDDHQFTAVFVTHSIYEAAYLCDRALVMRQGRISGEVTPCIDRSENAADQRSSAAFMAAVRDIETMMAQEI